ncbi:hypothetical protein ABTM19_21205, partial [Acinetobacter baumannii]
SQARLALFSPSRTQQIRLERAMNGEVMRRNQDLRGVIMRGLRWEACDYRQGLQRAIVIARCCCAVIGKARGSG